MIKRYLRTALATAAVSTGRLAAAQRRCRGQLVILCYHRILPADERRHYFCPDLAITPATFARQVRTLARHFRVLPLSDALQVWQHHQADERPLAVITFDDGYRDNYHWAAPILADAGLRATFYVIAGLIGSAQTAWYDRLARIGQHLHHAGQGHIVAAHPEVGPLLNGHAGPPDAYALVAAAKRLPSDKRLQLVDDLERKANLPPDTDARDQLMSWPEVRELADAGHEIGAHSLTHEILPALDDHRLRHEIATSRQVIREHLGRDIAAFCYPNGDTDERVAAAVREAGFAHAVTTVAGNNPPTQDRYHLRRWFIHEERQTGPAGIAAGALLRFEITGLRQRWLNRGPECDA